MDKIIAKLCASCVYEGNKCICIEQIEYKKYKTYKCLNYKQDISKIRPYEKFDYVIRSNNEKIKAMDINRAVNR